MGRREGGSALVKEMESSVKGTPMRQELDWYLSLPCRRCAATERHRLRSRSGRRRRRSRPARPEHACSSVLSLSRRRLVAARCHDFVLKRVRAAPMEDLMDTAERERLITRYRDGHRVVIDAFKGITDEELDRSASGEWTPRQTAHHLADSEMMSAIRIRRLLTEEKPVIHGYDEANFARKLTSHRPIEPSLDPRGWAREQAARLIECMP